MRENIKEYVYSKFSEETGAWILALVLGDDSLISKDITALFQRWSLSHLLAISGLHIGLVVGLLYFFTVKLQSLTIEKAQYLMMIFLPIYSFSSWWSAFYTASEFDGFTRYIYSKTEMEAHDNRCY